MRLIFSLLIFLLPTFAVAQNYPVHTNLYVNDFAAIISEEDEAVLMQQLETLRKEKGVEVTVLTIASRKTYGDSDSIESFATNLFNAWGIGNAKRNDGILILVAQQDREMRIELGKGYGDAFNAAAGDVIDQHFLISFQYDKYSEGIRTGTNEVIRRIVMPFAEGSDHPLGADKKTDWAMVGFFALLTTFLGGVMAVVFSGPLGKLINRMRKCPNCGRKGGVHRFREIIESATTKSSGSGKLITTCDYCDYHNEDNYTISRRSSSRSSSSSGGSSFGGGSSSGGGASGRW